MDPWRELGPGVYAWKGGPEPEVVKLDGNVTWAWGKTAKAERERPFLDGLVAQLGGMQPDERTLQDFCAAALAAPRQLLRDCCRRCRHGCFLGGRLSESESGLATTRVQLPRSARAWSGLGRRLPSGFAPTKMRVLTFSFSSSIQWRRGWTVSCRRSCHWWKSSRVVLPRTAKAFGAATRTQEPPPRSKRNR